MVFYVSEMVAYSVCLSVKDSPSSKLLFAKDIPTYSRWLSEYYANVRASPTVSDDDMSKLMLDMSRVRTSTPTLLDHIAHTHSVDAGYCNAYLEHSVSKVLSRFYVLSLRKKCAF